MTWSPWTRKAKAKAFSLHTHTDVCMFVCMRIIGECVEPKQNTKHATWRQKNRSRWRRRRRRRRRFKSREYFRQEPERERERKSKRSCRGRRVCLGLISHLRSLLSSVWPRRSAWGSDSHTSGESRAAGAGAGVARDRICMYVYLHNAYCLFVFVFAFISTFTIVAWFLRLFLLRRSFYCSFLQQVWPHCALCIELHSPHMKRAKQEGERERVCHGNDVFASSLSAQQQQHYTVTSLALWGRRWVISVRSRRFLTYIKRWRYRWRRRRRRCRR